ncbi:lipopolysaccharide transport periplasmic protein LptA [Zobellella maritima]|uniref:lipopolysaccharide transport periplasmic protein LptA n=1 Tax=Zobellella maritima TaxID=2059725 RepID=UPI000E301761|nr:lipopolysaccharide transport periplasmic protein LptA [Zobellella maritima]
MAPRQLITLSITGLLALSINLAQAKESDFNQQVTIDAGHQLVELSDDKVTFSDKVVVKQGSIDVRADKLVVIRNDDGLQSMIAYGAPATYSQILDNGQPMRAEAREIHYDIKARTITLLQEAKLKQRDNTVSGHRIRYHIDRQQMEAEGQGQQGRVTTVFLPEQVEDLENTGKQD